MLHAGHSMHSMKSIQAGGRVTRGCACAGLGRKSVACIMLLCLGKKAFPVDVNVGRISARLGWIPLDAEQALEVNTCAGLQGRKSKLAAREQVETAGMSLRSWCLGRSSAAGAGQRLRIQERCFSRVVCCAGARSVCARA